MLIETSGSIFNLDIKVVLLSKKQEATYFNNYLRYCTGGQMCVALN